MQMSSLEGVALHTLSSQSFGNHDAEHVLGWEGARRRCWVCWLPRDAQPTWPAQMARGCIFMQETGGIVLRLSQG